MDAERYQRVRRLLDEVSSLPEGERVDFLATIEDKAVRDHVTRLLGVAAVDTAEIFPGLGTPEITMPETIDGYRVGEEIGRGGMGIVYAAVDESDRIVALKVLPAAPGAAPGSGARFEREARAGALIDHPNVVRTLGTGTFPVNGIPIPYLAMEFVAGRTLRELQAELDRVPEGLLREIARQVALGLQAIHGAGIVHRDIKPENLLITDDEVVRIMDLGIAKLRDATFGLTIQGQFLGSLHYASPEQCEGDDVGPAADLYALGVTLYELATGINPFRREQPVAALRAHAEDVPTPASERVSDISPFFSGLIATLLEKKPEKRFGGAGAFIDALLGGERGAWWQERSRLLPASELPRIPVRRDSKLVGRDEELVTLRDAWDTAGRGTGAAVLIEGDAGMGKTRLIDTFLRELDAPDAHVLYGSFPRTRGMLGLTEAIRDKFGANLETGLKRLVRPDSLADALAAFVRGDGGAPVEGGLLATACTQLARSLAEERPTVWILDDLHRAPMEAASVAAALARVAGSLPLLVVLATRPVLDSQTLAMLTDDQMLKRLPLPRLSKPEVVELLTDALGDDALAHQLGARVARKSSGVPLFVLEVVRLLHEQQFLEQRDGSSVQTRVIDAIEVPSAVRDLVRTRLDELDRDARVLLDVASVEGFAFDADHVAAVLERGLVQVLQDLAELERRHGLVRPAGREYRFDHRQLQEVIYADLPPRLREEYHTLLAQRISTGDEPDPVFLAHHLLHGSRPEQGLEHLGAALDRLESRAAHEDAVRLLNRAIPMLMGRELVEALLRRTARLEILGRRDAQSASAEETFAAAKEHGDADLEADAHVAVGHYLWFSNRLDEALERMREQLDAARRSGDLKLVARAECDIGIALGRLQRREEAMLCYGDSIATARRADYPRMEARAMANLAILHQSRGEYDKAYPLIDRTDALYEKADNPRARANWEGVAGAVFWGLGHWDQARERFGRQLETSIATGDRRNEARAVGNLGLMAMEQGDTERGRECFTRHRAICTEIGDRESVGSATVNLANAEMTATRFEQALKFADEAARVADEASSRRIAAHSELIRGLALLSLDDLEQAEKATDLALERYLGTGNEIGIGMAHRAVGRIQMALGNSERAAKHLQSAIDIAEAVSAPGLLVICLALRAQLAGGDPAAAAAALDEHAARMGLGDRMEAAYLVHKATGDAARIEYARQLFDVLRSKMPPGTTAADLDRDPLYRALAETVS
ncbi:MAG: protein kinase domain-containing protein [Planctomycetota bacterium]|jgi:tetratricopeptide (TPR) repeat protein